MTDVLVPPAMTPPAIDPPISALAGTVAEGLVIAAAPSTGRFQPAHAVERFEVGDLVGHVTGGRGRADAVHAPAAGQLRGLLVRPGQLVQRGQALAWLAGDPGAGW